MARPPDPPALAEIVVRYCTTILDVIHLPRGGDFSVGEGPDADLPVIGTQLSNPSATAVVRSRGYGQEIEVPGGFEAHCVRAGRREPCPARVVLSKGLHMTLTRGDLSLEVSLVDQPALDLRRSPLDRPLYASVLGFALLFLVTLLMLDATPPDPLALAREQEIAQARLVSYFERNEDGGEPGSRDAERANMGAPSGRGEADARAKGPRGSRQGPRSPAAPSSLTLPQSPRADPGLSRRDDPQQAARSAGILGILAAQDQSFADLSGGAFGSSSADTLLWSATGGGSGEGVGGLSFLGPGRGGGGSASGVVGFGGGGLLGHGTGHGGLSYDEHATERGGAGFGGRQKRLPRTIICRLKVSQNIDRDIVRRVVRAHVNEVRACYNAGLTRKPTLEGRMTVQFSILSTGKVGTAVIAENTTGDTEVGRCVSRAATRWRFPAVRGGGTALVSYPFKLTTR